MIKNIIQDILNIYKNIMEEGKTNPSILGKGGYYPNHDLFQQSLVQIKNKYNLTCKIEYVGKTYKDLEKKQDFQREN